MDDNGIYIAKVKHPVVGAFTAWAGCIPMDKAWAEYLAVSLEIARRE